MPGLAIRIGLNVLGLWLAGQIVPGLQISGLGGFLAAALVLGIVNALVRPVAIVLTLPFTIASLGLFLLVVNAGMLALVAWLLEGFRLDGFGSALFGAVIVSLTGWLGSRYVGPQGSLELWVVDERGATR